MPIGKLLSIGAKVMAKKLKGAEKTASKARTLALEDARKARFKSSTKDSDNLRRTKDKLNVLMTLSKEPGFIKTKSWFKDVKLVKASIKRLSSTVKESKAASLGGS